VLGTPVFDVRPIEGVSLNLHDCPVNPCHSSI
jgi:hypothetical protein